MLDTSIYDTAIRGMELIEDDDKRDIGIGAVKLIPCSNTGKSTVTLEELISRAKENGCASSERQARQLLSEPSKIPYAPESNLLFVETRWRSADGLLWIPFFTMRHFPNLKEVQWILSLMCIAVPPSQGVLWVRHNNHHFVQIN